MWKTWFSEYPLNPLRVLEDCRTVFVFLFKDTFHFYINFSNRLFVEHFLCSQNDIPELNLIWCYFWCKVTDWELWQRGNLCLPVGPGTVQCEGAPPSFLPRRMQHWITQEREMVWSTRECCSVSGLPFLSQPKSCLQPQPVQTQTS